MGSLLTIRSLLAVAVMAMLPFIPASAADSVSNTSAPHETRLSRILADGVLRVGTTGDYKPFSYKDPATGALAGLDIEMAQEIAESLGVRLEWVSTSWPSLMDDLSAGRFDMALSGVSVNLARARTAYFSEPYQRDGKTPIALCDQQQKYQTLEQIDSPKVRVIVNPGGTNEKFVRQHLRQAQVVMHQDNVTIFQQIVEGKADLMITDAVETRLQEKLHPRLCAIHPDAPFDFSEKAALLPQDEALKHYVDQWLHQDIASGRFDKRMKHWLEYPWQPAHH